MLDYVSQLGFASFIIEHNECESWPFFKLSSSKGILRSCCIPNYFFLKMSSQNLDVELIPWDAQSESHVERLRQQRLACGWRAESVDEWRQKQLEKKKALHWIVSSVIIV